jgi:multidrug efflux system membrane fusion protein
MRRGIAAIVASACAALVLGVAFSFSPTRANRPPTPAAALPPAVPVVAAPVISGHVPIYLHGIGTVDAWNTVVVRSQIQGPLIRIAFKEGQMVHKGDLLAEIDPRPYRAQLEQAIANRDRDQANLQNAEINLKRYAMLLPNQLSVSQQPYDTQNATVAQLKASVKADEALLKPRG